MSVEIKVPSVGESINEVTLVKWLKKVGEYVNRDEVIAELESLLDQAQSGSVLLNLVFDQSGQVRDAQIVRGSGVSGLDRVAQQGALRWRLDPSTVQASDTTSGRRHLVKFFQNANVSRRVEPITAFWKEL